MKSATATEVKTHFGDYIKASEASPVVITDNGKPVAVLLGVTDEDELERLLLAHSPDFQALLKNAEQRIKETGGMQHEAFWQAVESET